MLQAAVTAAAAQLPRVTLLPLKGSHPHLSSIVSRQSLVSLYYCNLNLIFIFIYKTVTRSRNHETATQLTVLFL